MINHQAPRSWGFLFGGMMGRFGNEKDIFNRIIYFGWVVSRTYQGCRPKRNGGVTVFYYKETQNKVLKVKSDSYYRNGQKWKETTYKDGKKDGKWTTWNPNGLKSIERTYKDGEPDGLWTVWYENGQKKREVIYKDKKRFSYKTWNRDGSVME